MGYIIEETSGGKFKATLSNGQVLWSRDNACKFASMPMAKNMVKILAQKGFRDLKIHIVD